MDALLGLVVMTKNETQLSFCIWNVIDISHEAISNLLEITPSKVHIKGERLNPKFSKLATQNGWFLDSPAGPGASFEQQMDALLDILDPKMEVLKTICNKCYSEFSLAVWINDRCESMPSIHLSARYHAFANQLKSEFDVDMYCCDES